MAQPPPVDQGFLIIKDSWSPSDTPHSVGLLWASDQPGTETSTWRHTTLSRDRHPCSRRDSNPQSQQASGCRPHRHGYRQDHTITFCYFKGKWRCLVHDLDWSKWFSSTHSESGH
jgi:hypothetical protein